MKNVILLITDTFRYDNLFDNAKRIVNTPMLDRFVEERATSIDSFYAGSFPTIPHRTDVARGVVGWPHYPWQAIDVSGPNHIARILGHQGYITQLICDCPHLFNNRFQAGFTAAYQHRGQEGDRHLLHMNDPISEATPPDKTRQSPLWNNRTLADSHRWLNRYFNVEEGMFSAKTSRTTVRWLEENYRAEPFFLWVDFFDPHEPWDPPEYMVKRYQPEYEGSPMLHCNYGLATDYSDDELTNLWAHYAAEAEMVDRHLGQVLQKIDDLDLWSNSIVIVTSDHGTSLGEHNRTGKSNISNKDSRYWPIYPEVGHVPFLIGGGDIPAGNRLDMIAQPVDILPTLSDLAGFETNVRVPLQGSSFAQSLMDQNSDHRDVAVTGTFVRANEDGERPQRVVTPFVVSREFGYAPCGADGDPELYDIASDPLAENNIASSSPSAVKEMQSVLQAYLEEHNSPEETTACWQVEA